MQRRDYPVRFRTSLPSTKQAINEAVRGAMEVAERCACPTDQQADLESDLLDVYDPGQSIHGSRFAQELIGDREILVDPSSGYAKLQTREARITLSGGVLPDLVRYVEEGAEIMLIEPKETLHTGEQQTDQTVAIEDQEWI